MNSFLICQFSELTLGNLIKETFDSSFPDIISKVQIKYIYRYLSNIKAKSILLEKEYLDKDYLEDYSRYYIKSFNNNGYLSARLHFFSEEINHNYINSCLSKFERKKLDKLQNSYLGFMVIKPLNQTFIGRTCLKLYPDFNIYNSDKKCITRLYEVNLFGIKLQVESVAFQEQDKVVSACATTSIWTALHAMSWRAINEIPACSEITTNAINHIANSNNYFPKSELSNKQILRALDVEKLKHHSYSLKNISYQDFLSHIKTHIDSKIPLILGVDVNKIENDGSLSQLAGHAVTVLGYKFNREKSEQSIALYLHDDRLGPFVRATFYKITDKSLELVLINESLNKEQQWGLALQLKDEDGKWLPPNEILFPDSLIIPARKKVRLPVTYVYNTCKLIKEIYLALVKTSGIEVNNNNIISYNIELLDISSIKDTVIASKIIVKDPDDPEEKITKDEIQTLKQEKIKFLTTNYAKFHWVASFVFRGAKAFSILFDATQIPQGNVIAGIYVFNKFASDPILELFKQYANSDFSYQHIQSVEASETFYSSFIRFLKESELNYIQDLNNRFGGLRAPKYIKDSEIKNMDIVNNITKDKFYSFSNLNFNIHCIKLKNGSLKHMLWAISEDGALLIGEEINNQGHPCLTGFQSARIAGEIHYQNDNKWTINAKSGRYSGDYINKDLYLKNAIDFFKSIFIFEVNETIEYIPSV